MQRDRSTDEPQAEPISDSDRSVTLSSTIAWIAKKLGHESFLRGDLAALRRLNAERPSAPAFWRLLTKKIQPDNQPFNADAERRWALVVQGMAFMVPNHFDPKEPVGKVLRDCRYSELRLARFLNARGRMFRALFPRLCRYLATKGQPVNWQELARLVLNEGRNEDIAERIRLNIARRYYAAESRADKID